MSAMSIDIWSEPLAEPVANVSHVGNEGGGTRPAKRASLFLSDSEDEDTGSRKRDSANAASPPRDINEPAAQEAAKVHAMFDDLDDEDDWTVEPALDVEKMKRQAAARVAASTPAAQSVVPSLTPDAAEDNGDPTQNKEKDGKAKKVRRALPKLDEERLLGTDGFPRLLKEYKNFKVTGKGREVADLENLFHLYHGWTHKMYPKFQFRDTVDRVEKLCRSRRMGVNMRAWKDEAHGVTPEVRHEVTQDDEGNDGEGSEDDAGSTEGHAVGRGPPTSSPPSSRPSTPLTRPGSAASTAPSVPSAATENDGMDVDIEALLREEEEMMREIGAEKGPANYRPPDPVVDDDDELWASLGGIPEDIPDVAAPQKSTGAVPPPRDEVDDDDLWDIAAQMEAEIPETSKHESGAESNQEVTAVPAEGSAYHPGDSPIAPAEQPSVGEDWDDMYA